MPEVWVVVCVLEDKIHDENEGAKGSQGVVRERGDVVDVVDDDDNGGSSRGCARPHPRRPRPRSRSRPHPSLFSVSVSVSSYLLSCRLLRDVDWPDQQQRREKKTRQSGGQGRGPRTNAVTTGKVVLVWV